MARPRPAPSSTALRPATGAQNLVGRRERNLARLVSRLVCKGLYPARRITSASMATTPRHPAGERRYLCNLVRISLALRAHCHDRRGDKYRNDDRDAWRHHQSQRRGHDRHLRVRPHEQLRERRCIVCGWERYLQFACIGDRRVALAGFRDDVSLPPRWPQLRRTEQGSDATFATPLEPPPLVTTGAATSIGTTTVTLHGSINPEGALTDIAFRYGLASGTATTVTRPVSAGTGKSTENFSVQLTGLSGLRLISIMRKRWA